MKILIIGGGMPVKVIEHLMKHEVKPVTVDKIGKEAELKSELNKYIEHHRLSEVERPYLFPETKNYINGKKLPRKKR